MKDNNAAKRILHYSDAEIFRKHGWKAADLHVHTIFSPDVISVGSMHPDRLYRTARENGMDYVTFTDHDTLDAYETLNPDMPGLVSGVEIKVKDKSVGHTIHVNVYELDRVQFQMLEEIAAEGDLHGFLGSSLFHVGRSNCNFPSLRYIISMRFFVVLNPLALLFAD